MFTEPLSGWRKTVVSERRTAVDWATEIKHLIDNDYADSDDENLPRHVRTTNHLERLFREFRTKSDEIGAFPDETSCLTVFFLVVERDHANHDRKTMAKNS